jgi:hypothetical protein
VALDEGLFYLDQELCLLDWGRVFDLVLEERVGLCVILGRVRRRVRFGHQ